MGGVFCVGGGKTGKTFGFVGGAGLAGGGTVGGDG